MNKNVSYIEENASEHKLYQTTVGIKRHPVLVYRPKTANSYTPARTILLIASAKYSNTSENLAKFIRLSGWMRQADRDGSVLIAPLCSDGWETLSPHLPVDIWESLWGKVRSLEQGDYQRGTTQQAAIWMWETLWHMVGYDDGAVFAGTCCIAHPNRFASVALIGGFPHVFCYGDQPSDHFHISASGKHPERMVGVSSDYNCYMRDIPSAVWIITEKVELPDFTKSVRYFCRCNGIAEDEPASVYTRAGMRTCEWTNTKEPAQRVCVSEGDGKSLCPQQLMDLWIGASVRWKNSPDGTLKTFFWKDQVEYGQSPYQKYCYRMETEDDERIYYAYVPEKLPQNAPVVLTIHGHGEPAWMFLSKNGWPQLADREKFLVVSPESCKKNRWVNETDTAAFPVLIDDICRRFSVDRGRIYLSGFSNGNDQCYNAAAAYPHLFAGIFPMSRAAAAPMCLDKLAAAGLELPMFGVTGDNDGWICESPALVDSDISRTIETFCRLSSIALKKADKPNPFYWQFDEVRGPDWYKKNQGLTESHRFYSWAYQKDGIDRVVITVMKNMPHGSIWDETVAAWKFLSRFYRQSDGTIKELR